MNTRNKAYVIRGLAVLSVLGMLGLCGAGSAHAAGKGRVLLVVGRGVSDDAEQTLTSAISADAEVVDPSEYVQQARSRGLLPTSDAALQRVAPSLHPSLIVVATKAGSKLHLQYRDGQSGEVLDKDTVSASHRGAAAAKTKTRVQRSVRKLLASVASQAQASAPPVAAQPIAEVPDDSWAEEPQPKAAPVSTEEPSSGDVLTEPEAPVADEQASDAEPFLFELSAGIGGTTRDSALPTRLGEHQLNTGLSPGASVGLRLGGMLGPHAQLTAAADYRTSLGLQGVESQRATEMSTPLRSHGIGFGIEPGYRFGAAGSVSLVLHLGWYFRGLRPIAQLALPEMSWHAAVVRPELHIPFSSAVTLRLAPELLVVAGLETSLPDQSGIAHTGTGFGAEASLDVRLAAPVSLRLEYRESHVSLGTAWSHNLTDVERFGALRVVLRY